MNNWWERLLDRLGIPVIPEFQDDLSQLDRFDGLGRGETENLERFWSGFDQSEKDDLERYIAGDYPA